MMRNTSLSRSASQTSVFSLVHALTEGPPLAATKTPDARPASGTARPPARTCPATPRGPVSSSAAARTLSPPAPIRSYSAPARVQLSEQQRFFAQLEESHLGQPFVLAPLVLGEEAKEAAPQPDLNLFQRTTLVRREVREQVGSVPRRFGAICASIGSAVLMATGTVAQPFMRHMPVPVSILLTCAAVVFGALLLVGPIVEYVAKRYGLRSLSEDTMERVESLINEMVARETTEGVPLDMAEAMAKHSLQSLVDELIGGSWRSLQIAFKHGAAIDLSPIQYRGGELRAAWRKANGVRLRDQG